MPKKTAKTPGTSSLTVDRKDYIGLADDYVSSVLNGTTPACKWVQLACQRQRDDLARSRRDAGWLYGWSPEAGARVCQFIELLPHIKGPKAGGLIEVEPWQCFVLSTPFGWMVRTTGKRRYRRVYDELPRGNAKSTLSSGVGLYMGFADNEGGAEVYSSATTQKQARIVLDAAQHMARRSPSFRSKFGVEVSAHSIHQLSSASMFEAVSSEEGSLDGKNIHLGIIDEFHAHKTRGVYDVLETGVGKRDQSMLWAITTAGWNLASVCYEIRKYLLRVLLRDVEDEQFFGVIYTIDEEDDWTTEAALRKANPNYGISVEPDTVLGLQRKAMQIPSAVNNFLTKHLNVWVSSDAGLFDMRAWARSGDSSLKIEQFKEFPCWIGIDLGFVDDIAAVVVMFKREDEYVVFGDYYLPESTVQSSRNSQYSGWERSGYITQTEGQITDINVIVDELLLKLNDYDVQEVVYDPYNKLRLLNALENRGVGIEKLVDYPQTVPNMSPATELLMQAVIDGKVKHDGNPVLSWAAGNVVGHFDNKDNVYPKKERPEYKIDPMIALIMCVGRSMVSTEQPSAWANSPVVI